MHDKNIMIYRMGVYTRFKAGMLFWSRGTVDSTMIRLRAEGMELESREDQKPFRFPKRSDRLCGQSTLLISGYTSSSLEVKRPKCEFDH
jgi:hypothetical protein